MITIRKQKTKAKNLIEDLHLKDQRTDLQLNSHSTNKNPLDHFLIKENRPLRNLYLQNNRRNNNQMNNRNNQMMV
jgi:hypothetical protein